MLLKVLLIIIQVIFLETILSIDNALVLATIAKKLPRDKGVPLPKGLNFLRKPFSKIFANQRQAALEVGLLGAYAGRTIMLIIAAFIVNNPWLKILGAFYLLHLSLKNLGELAAKHETLEQEIKEELVTEQYLKEKIEEANSFWQTVAIIEMSDLIFSLDNVVAIVALSKELVVLIIGVAIGILLIRLAAQQLIHILHKYPALEIAGYILILNISIELFATIFLHIHINELNKFLISITTILLALAYDIFLKITIRKKINRALIYIGKLFLAIDSLITLQWLKPVFNAIMK